MAETMNMKELFALLVRRCRAVLLTALIFAVLLGGVQAFRTSRSNSDESDVSAEEKIASQYADLAALKQQLTTTKGGILTGICCSGTADGDRSVPCVYHNDAYWIDPCGECTGGFRFPRILRRSSLCGVACGNRYTEVSGGYFLCRNRKSVFTGFVFRQAIVWWSIEPSYIRDIPGAS